MNMYSVALLSINYTETYTIMLLIGIWISFTKNPMNPIIAKPIAVAMAIFWNSTIYATYTV